MNCIKCGGIYQEQYGEIPLYDDSIGSYSVLNVSYEKCDQCGELLFPPETIQAIEDRRNEIKNELVGREPISAFISASETASILGITRQALNKHRRIRRGFIYRMTIGGVTVYHGKSVELFKEKEDGRFELYLRNLPSHDRDVAPLLINETKRVATSNVNYSNESRILEDVIYD